MPSLDCNDSPTLPLPRISSDASLVPIILVHRPRLLTVDRLKSLFRFRGESSVDDPHSLNSLCHTHSRNSSRHPTNRLFHPSSRPSPHQNLLNRLPHESSMHVSTCGAGLERLSAEIRVGDATLESHGAEDRCNEACRFGPAVSPAAFTTNFSPTLTWLI